MNGNFDKTPIDGGIQHLAQPLAHAAQAVLTMMGVVLSPIWTIPIVSAFGLYGFYLFYKQDELNKFMTWIKEHPSEFAETVVQQSAFQDGFIITLEEYLKARSEEKREMIRSVFLGFASEKEKVEFDLERMYGIIRLISKEQVDALKLFQKEEFIDLNPEGDFRSEMKSLESLGLAVVETNIQVENQDEMDGDQEDGFHPTGRQIAFVERKDWAILTEFGKRFMSFCGLI